MAKRKTKKSIYHHLHLNKKGGMIYYNRRFADRREHFSTQTKDWDEAAQVRDEFERKRSERVEVQSVLPTFAAFAQRYRDEATGHLAATTKEDRKSQLRSDGRILRTLGHLRLDQITRKGLLEWWNAEILSAGLSTKTGRNYLDAISTVLNYAWDLEIIDVNPANDLRGTLRRRNRTQQGRAGEETEANPIEDLAVLHAFYCASMNLGGDGHLADLLMLDGGLRRGEAFGLRWCDVRLGKNMDDLHRSIAIRQNYARGRHMGKPKSGRPRDVDLSRRVRSLLRKRWMAEGKPRKGEAEWSQPILRLDANNYARRHFASVCEEARIEELMPKQLRDTFASQLLTAGVQLAYISEQLGHDNVQVTARHYARWAATDAYRRPMELLDGEHPADLLARMVAELPDLLPDLTLEGVN